ncbi:hypothetical protein ElyMa_001886300 [Elysia marginata]|uniref:Uncharacterized protein n=1 Tax=Elysia marginata TaxID=1093978 RepID=A0AAV4ER32_9GAST|nr:hypothetical protein ElyMa_001886300 [Elysia marginata]
MSTPDNHSKRHRPHPLVFKQGSDPSSALPARMTNELGSVSSSSTSSLTTIKSPRPHFDPLHLVRKPSRPRSMPCSPHNSRRTCSISGPDGVQYLISGEFNVGSFNTVLVSGANAISSSTT